MFKKTALTLLVLGSSSVFSGTMGPVCTPGNATVPCEQTTWDIGIQALYLQSMYSNSELNNLNIGSGSGVRIFEKYPDNFEWGFRLEGAYHFNTGNDLTLNWTYWQEPNDLRINPAPGRVAGQTQATIIDYRYRGSDFNQVNVEFGQHVDFGANKNIRFHGGVQYANVDVTLIARQIVSGLLPPDDASNGDISITNRYKFSGAGPRIGTDLSYDFLNGFAIYANAATALLAGDTKYSDNAPFNQTGRPVRSSYLALVPELEAKIGATYTYGMTQGNLIFDLGYMVANYFSPLHENDLSLETLTFNTRPNSDFGLMGAYAGIKYTGSV
ncbi:Lpg1974 family pore-forming outer membrane protein [Legionella worsleiensis]|uniref:Outer membrane protein n=1 Tax=Legionella worsleiensis TaxID=45076 RepID=A0A0W1AIU4_9GAMM|nr:Lpg1974 family pore-forming outer membrane protein [Legionella worsleiensis]KTD81166.1 outer membrane protein [Legionella worsleiensis]STY33141.1 outer membrane protein [Legionella worsleiensis]